MKKRVLFRAPTTVVSPFRRICFSSCVASHRVSDEKAYIWLVSNLSCPAVSFLCWSLDEASLSEDAGRTLREELLLSAVVSGDWL